jgi:hypothetical protein
MFTAFVDSLQISTIKAKRMKLVATLPLVLTKMLLSFPQAKLGSWIHTIEKLDVLKDLSPSVKSLVNQTLLLLKKHDEAATKKPSAALKPPASNPAVMESSTKKKKSSKKRKHQEE